MKIEQIYTKCLAQGAYLIVCCGEAAIIDPLRETAPYIEQLKKENVQLKYIFETHFHADFVSGHLDLAAKTGAKIIYGPQAQPDFPAIIAKDEEIFEIGKIKIKAIHTPGHTMESTCYLLLDKENKPTALFSGDTLFLGDVGRPDLAQKAADMTQEDLAGMLYDSIYNKLLPLPDEVIVYPAHGAGSACGKNMIDATQDPLGNQKKTNYALNQPNKSAFIAAVLEGLTAPPNYFGDNVKMNKSGYENFDAILEKNLKALQVEEFKKLMEDENQDIIVLDTRAASEFAQGFVAGSINIGLKGDFAPWVGTILEHVDQKLLLICEKGTEAEAITRLSRVGFDQVLGFLEGGFENWKNQAQKIEKIGQITAEDFAKINEKINVLDVRKAGEFEKAHWIDGKNLPLLDIHLWAQQLNKKEPFYIHCAGGYRSMIAASFLKRQGFEKLVDIAGGFNAMAKTSCKIEEGISACSLNK